MSDYIKSTNFASKDSLTTGNPAKVVKGTEIDTEFNNIANAVSSKADLASPTFTGTPSAPTATAGTNTSQLATTSFVTTAVANVTTVANATNATNSTNATNLVTSSFSIKEAAGKLVFYFGTTAIASLDSSGNFIVLNNISGFTTP